MPCEEFDVCSRIPSPRGRKKKCAVPLSSYRTLDRCPCLLNTHIHDIEREPLRRQRADRIWRHPSPGLISSVSDLRVQVQQELVRETFERRRLAERQAQADRLF